MAPTHPASHPNLADDLVGFVVEKLEALERSHLPGLRVPGVFAGHLVAPDVRADLAFTLSHLCAAGVDAVAGVPVDEAIMRVLRPIDGPGTHTFFSYRVSETIAGLGGIGAVPAADRANLEAACDSTDHLPRLVEGRLPPNYAAVLLRCEVGRQRLGLDIDEDVLADLVARTTKHIEGHGGYLDDSHAGAGRYDIYTGDIYLFTEPMADLLGPAWEEGARTAVALVERVGATNGAAFHWGRSTGALAACLTVELGGLVAKRGLGADVPTWLGRAHNALDHFGGWVSADGLITAHQRRSTYGYRGPHRRLQMTLDCLGKLADTAAVLRALPAVEPVRDRDRLFPAHDQLIRFDTDRHAGVWSYRSRDLAFVLPLLGATWSDYAPAPHNPGLFEVPVDTALQTAVPYAFRGGVRYTSGGLPVHAEKIDAGLTLRYEGFPIPHWDVTPETDHLRGTREVTYRVEGRTLHVDVHLHFDDVPQALGLQVAERSGRPLRVDFRCDAPHASTVVDVSGLKEMRSFWSELDRVHQVDIEPRADVALSWSVTPVLRVLSTAADHWYPSSVLGPLVAAGDVVVRQSVPHRLVRPGALDDWDVFHLHWPEWSFGRVDLAFHEQVIAALQDARVRILWTQHNLVPHDKDPRHGPAYHAWAAAADAVVHHSEHGRRLVVDRYRFRDGAIHEVIPHPHFGHLHGEPASPRPQDGPIRLGVVGAPRAEKDVQLVMDAVAACSRTDVELVVWSLGPDDVVPDDPRITAVPYERVSAEEYAARLHRVDALVLPFAPDGMLTTGTIGDVIGAGLPAIVSDWPFLTEALGDAGIRYGGSREELTTLLEGVDREQLASAAAASRALQPLTSKVAIAAKHLALLEQLGTTRL